MHRSISSDVVEQWMAYLRRQRRRANEMIWQIEQGLTLHEGRAGVPERDVTAKRLEELRAIVTQVDELTQLYHDANS